MDAALEKDLPGFLDQVKADAKSKKLLALWGLSRNHDESAPSVYTIPPNILGHLNRYLNVEYNNTFSVGHAGLNHTYGYLFSTVLTPYGYKRARYVQGEIELGFGLPAKTFGGVASSGTLLSNLTYFLGSVAFPKHETFRSWASSPEFNVSPALAAFDFKALKVRRLVETAELSTQAPGWELTLQTDVVYFQNLVHTPALTNQALLIYSLDLRRSSEPSRPVLITAFPVTLDFADTLFKQPGINLDVQVPLKVKYNGMLPTQVGGDRLEGGFVGQRMRTEPKL
jgi:hypothetical protein